MKLIHLELPMSEYTHLQRSGTLSDLACREISEAIQNYGARRVVVFGAQSTGLALRELLGEGFLSFVDSETLPALPQMDFDAVLIATSPLHYQTILGGLSEGSLRDAVNVILFFSFSSEVDIRLVLETQPRSGTHYVIDNLIQSLQWGYGTVFQEDTNPPLKRSRDGRFGYVPSWDGRSYLLKAHFTQPLHFPEYRYVKTMFQICHIFDSYYSWGRMLAPTPQGSSYRLQEASREWAILRSYIPLNKEWLSYIRDRFYVRYEDYCNDFATTIRRISDFLGISCLDGFEPPRANPKRTYWSDGYSQVMDENVFLHLLREFSGHIQYYWPEKGDLLKYK